jgi:hypothetical protein
MLVEIAASRLPPARRAGGDSCAGASQKAPRPTRAHARPTQKRPRAERGPWLVVRSNHGRTAANFVSTVDPGSMVVGRETGRPWV